MKRAPAGQAGAEGKVNDETLHQDNSTEGMESQVFRTYDEYVEAMKPRYTIQCPRCKREYTSDDGDTWFGDSDTYNTEPVSGSVCIECDFEEARHDPDHWAAQAVLYTPKALKEVLHDFTSYNTLGGETKAICAIFKAMLNDEDFRASCEAYLDNHSEDVWQEVHDHF